MIRILDAKVLNLFFHLHDNVHSPLHIYQITCVYNAKDLQFKSEYVVLMHCTFNKHLSLHNLFIMLETAHILNAMIELIFTNRRFEKPYYLRNFVVVLICNNYKVLSQSILCFNLILPYCM